MPIHVDIAINERLITRVHIARMEDLRGEDHEHIYSVVQSEQPPYAIDYAKGALFTHYYNEGAEVCVEKALVALRESKK